MASISIHTGEYTSYGTYPEPTGDGCWNLLDGDDVALPTYWGNYEDMMYTLDTGDYTLCPSSYQY